MRAIAVVGPTGAGKTALIQALASAASGGSGAAPTAAGQSTETSFTAIDFMGDHYALIDAPGAVDFFADADFALPAVDMALVVADPDPDKAVLLQPFLNVLEEQNIPHALFINKIDQARGRMRDLLEALQPVSALPLVARQIPIWEDEKVSGFVDLALERAYHYQTGQALAAHRNSGRPGRARNRSALPYARAARRFRRRADGAIALRHDAGAGHGVRRSHAGDARRADRAGVFRLDRAWLWRPPSVEGACATIRPSRARGRALGPASGRALT